MGIMEEAGVPKAPRLGHATSHQTRPNPVRDDSGADLFILHPDQLWGDSVPASKHQRRRRYSYDTSLAQDML